MGQQLEGRLNRAQDVLKRIGRARDRKTDVSVRCLDFNLKASVRVPKLQIVDWMKDNRVI